MSFSSSRLALVLLALLLGGAIYGSATLQGTLAHRRAEDSGRFDALRTELARADAGMLARSYSRDLGAGIPAILEVRDIAARAAETLRRSGDWPAARQQARALDQQLAAWTEQVGAIVLSGSNAAAPADLRAMARATAGFDRLLVGIQRDLDEDGREDQNQLTLVMILTAFGLVAAAGTVTTLTLGRRQQRARRRAARETELRDQTDAFAAAMQLVAHEDEAHGLLGRHIERSLAGADAVVLNRNNSDNRLEPTTAPPEDLQARLEEGIEPRDCLAVRAGRRHTRTAGEQPLIACNLCGARERSSTCQPLLVSGEVIGSVLVGHPEALDDLDLRAVTDAVTQAAPILGNLRTLALAETRAATDALTGLPNRRALQDTLKRMVAQSQRSLTPLATLALDLDHFKQVNDRFGHEKGDEVLAAVGHVLTDGIRDSDFAARSGGEEFVLLLPNTDVEGGRQVAAKLCQAIAGLEVPGVERRITASIGVAGHPLHAVDAATLLRKADRALYAAKEAGRDRVEVASVPVVEPAPA